MASKIITKGLKRTALSVALGMCFTGSVYAQSNSTGNISGEAAPGATAIIDNAATGFHREVSVGADGNYRVSSLPPGTYTVTVKNADGSTAATRTVNVNIGTTASATTLGTVTVQGGGMINPIDVASVDSTTIMTAEQIAKIPVARNVTGVALLAPGTVRGDAAFGNLASFGGSSVSENQYYVNGFNITNAFQNLNFGQVPFEAIAEQQIKTGGYGAEFGRSTGGVVNLVTKRGTNEFHAGGNIFVTPQSLREQNPNIYTNAGYNGVVNGVRPSQLFADNSEDKVGTTTTASVWASGALIKDRLFGYALLQYSQTTGTNNYGSAFDLNRRSAVTQNTSSDSESPTNWLLKMDWNISDNHILELTAFSDSTEREITTYKNPSSLLGSGYYNAENALVRGDALGTFYQETGGTSASLKYTGYLTDNFTISALYGHGENKRSEYAVYANGVIATYNGDIATGAEGCPVISDARTSGSPLTTCNFFGSIGSPNNKDERDQFRIDAEWALGDHRVRFGYDRDEFTSRDATDLEGGAQWIIYDDNIAEGIIFRNGAEVTVDSTAFYVEDTWNITDNFMVYGGLRWDSFENKNGDGATFVEIKNQFAPRLGFSWDVNGDSSFKVFGNAGRYALPLTATVAIRGASASIYGDNIYSYTSLDPVTSEPLGLTLLEEHYYNGENGQPKDPLTVADQGLKPQYQDEYILGFQFKLNDNITAGVRGTYRDLKSAIDDFCDYRYFAQYATDNGMAFDTSNYVYCHLFNPGQDAVFFSDLDADGDLEEIPVPGNYYATLRSDPYDPASPLAFTPEQIALMDKGMNAKRTYKALEFFFEGHWDKLSLQGSYTWAKSSGNFEGGVKSDTGQDDTGTTSDFDYPELAMGSTGYLPNDRRHSFKLFGNYEINDQWSAGFNLLVQAGRPQNCFGIYGSDPTFYRNVYFSCDSGQGTLTGSRYNNGTTIVDRGTRGRTAWSRSLDLNVAYTPRWGNWGGGQTTLKMDVFNVFNEHTPSSGWERGEDRVGRSTEDTYLIPTSFQAPRSFRFMVQYDY